MFGQWPEPQPHRSADALPGSALWNSYSRPNLRLAGLIYHGAEMTGAQVNGEPLVRAEGVWKVFGPNGERVIGTPDCELSRADLREKRDCVIAVRDVTLDIKPGEVFVVMGLSGSGKSTLVRTLIRLIEPSAGKIRIGDRDVMAADGAGLRELRRHTVSMVFQHFGLLAHRRVIDNVAFGLEIQGVDKSERLGRASEMLHPGRARGRRQPVPRPALGRHAAARGPGARVRRRPAADALRRALQRARPADPARHAGRGDPAPGRDRQDDALHHPRPARGAAARRPHRDHARRRDRPARHPRGARRLARRRVRGELHPRHPAHPRAHAALDHARAARRRGARGPGARRDHQGAGRRARGGRHRRPGAGGRGRPRGGCGGPRVGPQRDGGKTRPASAQDGSS